MPDISVTFSVIVDVRYISYVYFWCFDPFLSQSYCFSHTSSKWFRKCIRNSRNQTGVYERTLHDRKIAGTSSVWVPGFLGTHQFSKVGSGTHQFFDFSHMNYSHDGFLMGWEPTEQPIRQNCTRGPCRVYLKFIIKMSPSIALYFTQKKFLQCKSQLLFLTKRADKNLKTLKLFSL